MSGLDALTRCFPSSGKGAKHTYNLLYHNGRPKTQDVVIKTKVFHQQDKATRTKALAISILSLENDYLI
jgi:hypothetical protein